MLQYTIALWKQLMADIYCLMEYEEKLETEYE